MSRIETVACERLSVPLHTPFVTALRSTTATETLVVRVTDGDGMTGWGEAPQVWRVTGESLAGAEACVSGPLTAAIAGGDADDLAELCRRVAAAVPGNFGAKSSVDVALHDLAARRLGVSLPRFLGTAVHQVPTDVTLAASDAASLGQVAEKRVADGFTVLKVKVGTSGAEDVERVRAVRERVGPDVTIRLDANQGWDRRQAVRVIRGIEDAGLDVELVEQPVPAHDLDGLTWVTDRVDTPILADEAVYGVRDLVELIRRHAADMVNVKLAKCGGLSAARTMLSLAAAYGVEALVGSMMESPIGVAAAASLAAAHGGRVVDDLDAAWWAAASPVRGGLTYDGATVVLPDAPGLGVEGLA
jgi:L-alanine-DL-glutamate epimerase-like enolase superfamily enzyme